jgi:hypothetical protein
VYILRYFCAKNEATDRFLRKKSLILQISAQKCKKENFIRAKNNCRIAGFFVGKQIFFYLCIRIWILKLDIKTENDEKKLAKKS